MVFGYSPPTRPPPKFLWQTSIPSLLSIAFLALAASAAPTPENIALAQKYAPEFRFQ